MLARRIKFSTSRQHKWFFLSLDYYVHKFIRHSVADPWGDVVRKTPRWQIQINFLSSYNYFPHCYCLNGKVINLNYVYLVKCNLCIQLTSHCAHTFSSFFYGQAPHCGWVLCVGEKQTNDLLMTEWGTQNNENYTV